MTQCYIILSRANYQHCIVTIKNRNRRMTWICELISWRVRPARDDCQEAMLRCPGLGYYHLEV